MGDELELVNYSISAYVSIHVPRMGDDRIPTLAARLKDVSIHVPRMGDVLFSFYFSFCF